MKPFLFAALPLGLLLAAPAAAQDGTADLPPACVVKADPHAGHGMATSSDAMSMEQGTADSGHQALMDSMKGMADMGAAMAAPDLDVAFVCGMIPHHRAAVAMAQAELAHGDDPWARKVAEAIIAAQEREIAEMTAWLEKQPR